MQFPLISEYIDAIQNAKENFASLTNLRMVQDNHGNPIMSTGNYSVVFKMKDQKTEKLYGVKCFIKDQNGREDAYMQISQKLKKLKSEYLTHFEYKADELFVDTLSSQKTDFPVVVMDWVEGNNLFDYVKTCKNDKLKLDLLVYDFCKFASWLMKQSFAHGDIKPDNIIIKEDGSIVLIDYDGMYIPEMQGMKARELGSPNFRHPQRTIDDYNSHIDDFALALLLLSLKVFSVNPDLIDKYCLSDSFLFTESDFTCMSDSQATRDLLNLLYDQDVSKLYAIFMMAFSQKDCSSINADAFNFDFSYEVIRAKINQLDADKKYDQAILLLEKLAKEGNARAESKLCSYYLSGRGNQIKIDLAKALAYAQSSSSKGEAQGQRLLGLMLLNGKGIEKDINKAIFWISESAKQEDKRALCLLGKFYVEGQFVEKDEKRGFKYVEQSAKLGYPKAQFLLSQFYYNGVGVAQDEEQYQKYVQLAAEQNCPDALIELGLWYYDGYYFKKDEYKAKSYLEKAANLGSGEAYYELGNIAARSRGWSWEKNCCSNYLEAHKKGFLLGTTKLGLCCMNGIGTAKNYDTAQQLFKKAHLRGETYGSYFYAQSLITGDCPEKDVEKAILILSKLGEDGMCEAQIMLLKTYMSINASEEYYDLEKAVRWADLLSKQSNGEALYYVAILYQKLNGDEDLQFKHYIEESAKLGYYQALVAINQEYRINTLKDQVTSDILQKDQYGLFYSLDGCILHSVKEPSPKIIIQDGTKIITDKVFYDCEIEELVIPDSVIAIGINPISCCRTIKKITCHSPYFKVIDDMLLTSDLKRLISYWGRSKKVIIPEGVEVIDPDVFFCASGLQFVNIPSSLKTIGEGAFYRTGLQSLVLPDSVSSIGKKCFAANFHLTKVHLSSSLETISRACFASCTFKEISMPSSIKKIEDGAFANCSLKYVELSENLETIGVDAFNGCKDIEEIHLPSSLKHIEKRAFAQCKDIKLNSLPESIESIDDFAFYNNSDDVIIIPESLVDLSPLAFSHKTKLSPVTSSIFFADNNFVYKKDREGITIFHLQPSCENNITIPLFVSKVGSYSFKSSNITEISIPTSVRIIGTGAFDDCKLVKTIQLPASKIELKKGALSGMESLAQVFCFSPETKMDYYTFSKVDLDFYPRRGYSDYATCYYLAGSTIDDYLFRDNSKDPIITVYVVSNDVCDLDGRNVNYRNFKVVQFKP